MQQILNDIIVGQIFAFLLIFMRFGMALMIMPGIGDSFVSTQIRLLFAVALSFVMTPFLMKSLPPMPVAIGDFLVLMISEAFIGVFIGTVMRILISALDTAGMVISIQSGFSNALVFNPLTASQGSLMGALYSTLGVTLLLVTNLHHVMLASVVESYQIFPAIAQTPDMESMSDTVARTVNVAFKIGVQIALPFIVVGVLIQMGLGLLNRLMPQLQIYFIALPAQIAISLVMLAMVLSAGMMFWLSEYKTDMLYYIGY
jgi:flagellar biosynthetic protein FliR